MSITPDRTPVVHIGMPKTATKTLQWRLFSQHDDIFYLGRFDGEPFAGQYLKYKACRDETVLRIMENIAYKQYRQPDIKKCRRLLKEYLVTNNQDNLIPVWSWESYSTDSRHNRYCRATNLKQVFGDAKIVITIRHPISLLESAYMQQLKRDNVGGRYRLGKGLFYCSIDKWVKRDLHGDVSDHLDYAETIKLYIEQFGQKNVCVLVFEDLLANKVRFYQRLCRFMGIESQQALTLVAENIDNSRWTNVQLDRLQSISRSLKASLHFRFSTREERKALLDLDNNGEPLNPGKKTEMAISAPARDEILNRTHQGNEWLDQTFDLQLKRHGYYQ